MTSFPPRRFKLGSRGLIVPEYKADLTIFNPDTINDLATYEDPIQTTNGKMIKANQVFCSHNHH